MRSEADPFFPLRLGMKHIYRVLDPELPGGRGVLQRDTEMVEERDAGIYASLRETLRIDGEAPRVQRVEALVSIIGVREGERWILKTPLRLDTAWEDGPDQCRIAELEAVVRVPVGTLGHCVRVTYGNEDTGGGIFWFSRDVGLVKAEQYGERGPYLWELESAGTASFLYTR